MNVKRDNVDIMAEYCDRMIRGDFSALDDLVSPDWITHAEPQYILKGFSDVTCAVDGERVFFQQVIQAFKERELILNKNMAIDDDHVVINYTIRGIHNGGYFFDVPPSGKEQKIHGTAILRFENGVIVEHWGGPTCCTCTGYAQLDNVEMREAAVTNPASN